MFLLLNILLRKNLRIFCRAISSMVPKNWNNPFHFLHFKKYLRNLSWKQKLLTLVAFQLELRSKFHVLLIHWIQIYPQTLKIHHKRLFFLCNYFFTGGRNAMVTIFFISRFADASIFSICANVFPFTVSPLMLPHKICTATTLLFSTKCVRSNQISTKPNSKVGM